MIALGQLQPPSEGNSQVEIWKARIIRILPRLIPVSRCCIYETDENLTPLGHLTADGESCWRNAYINHFHNIDPCRPSQLAKLGLNVVIGENVIPLRRLMRTEYYLDFMKPMGALHKVELLFKDASGKIRAGLRATRTADQGPFLGDEIEALRDIQSIIQTSMSPIFRATHQGEEALNALTTREREVAILAMNGLSNKAIARRLGTSPPTVKAQLSSGFRKLGIVSRCQLAVLCLRDPDVRM